MGSLLTEQWWCAKHLDLKGDIAWYHFASFFPFTFTEVKRHQPRSSSHHIYGLLSRNVFKVCSEVNKAEPEWEGMKERFKSFF